jgi:hypothetical protein
LSRRYLGMAVFADSPDGIRVLAPLNMVSLKGDGVCLATNAADIPHPEAAQRLPFLSLTAAVTFKFVHRRLPHFATSA